MAGRVGSQIVRHTLGCPASRWELALLTKADALGAAVRSDLDPNLSVVHENVRSRANCQRL